MSQLDSSDHALPSLTISNSSNSNNLLCPECGEFVYRLIERTGWCRNCTNEFDNNDPECQTCGRTKQPAAGGGLVCTYCKLEAWLAKRADHIEHYLAKGQSLTQAIDSLRSEVRPRCASCGAVIKHGRGDAVFCHKTVRCKRAVRIYKYLTSDKGLPPAQALGIVLERLNGNG